MTVRIRLAKQVGIHASEKDYKIVDLGYEYGEAWKTVSEFEDLLDAGWRIIDAKVVKGE